MLISLNYTGLHKHSSAWVCGVWCVGVWGVGVWWGEGGGEERKHMNSISTIIESSHSFSVHGEDELLP